MLIIPKRLSSEVLGRYVVFDVSRHRVQFAPLKELDVYTLDMPDWCTVVALTDDEHIVMIRQHRHGVDDVMLETPGGIVDDGESPADAAGRELFEETGWQAAEIRSLGWVHPNPAIQRNRIHLFLGTGTKQVGEPHLDAHESTDVVISPLADVMRQLRDGSVRHALSALALERAFSTYPPLSKHLGKSVG